MHSKPLKTLLVIELEKVECGEWDGICYSPEERICHEISSRKNDAFKGRCLRPVL